MEAVKVNGHGLARRHVGDMTDAEMDAYIEFCGRALLGGAGMCADVNLSRGK